MTKILVTGGAGYIGSHTVIALLEQGFTPVIFDDFSNSHKAVLSRIEKISGILPVVIEGNIKDEGKLEEVFAEHSFDAVIHFAGLKAVGESVKEPLRYYQNNVSGSLQLFQVMAKHSCFRLVFSSSATVYGEPRSVPIKENFPLRATNPYGQTKLMIENILRDLSVADVRWQTSILRYFNPVGAHTSGLIGENPNGIPNNLVPYIAQVAVGKLERLSVFGGDYATSDGTGVRDYIHVVDLAAAHLKALNALENNDGCHAYNIGTGRGYSVLEIISAFEKVSGVEIPYLITSRRSGDVATSYADPSFSEKKLGWRAQFSLDDMMRDHWRWQSSNLEGYG